MPSKVIVIPARMKSSRFPGKPLFKIKGLTILERVYLQCLKAAKHKQIYVATESKEIVSFCKKKNIQCINTGKAETALDRIAKFSYHIQSDFYVNVQGDEPIIDPRDIKKIMKFSNKYKNAVLIGKAKCNKKTFYDLSKAKIVTDKKNKVLYSSRNGIPITNKNKFIRAEKAIWIYSLPKKLIRLYHRSKQTNLEKIEENEVLRFMEIGIDVYAIDLIGKSWAVDEKKDINFIKKFLS
jgi:3-deoxy-manno-octulosonate cytidylyltransferase (CMP-KDO synthetase)